ncbi:hypothetical protein NFI96_024773 [Prochilodus magdalenae]|nr:hypothetical protein NFI96_024773 [Prochilodus magdalenae]
MVSNESVCGGTVVSTKMDGLSSCLTCPKGLVSLHFHPYRTISPQTITMTDLNTTSSSLMTAMVSCQSPFTPAAPSAGTVPGVLPVHTGNQETSNFHKLKVHSGSRSRYGKTTISEDPAKAVRMPVAVGIAQVQYSSSTISLQTVKSQDYEASADGAISTGMGYAELGSPDKATTIIIIAAVSLVALAIVAIVAIVLFRRHLQNREQGTPTGPPKIRWVVDHSQHRSDTDMLEVYSVPVEQQEKGAV